MEDITLLGDGRVYCVVEGFGDGDVDPYSNRKVSLVRGAVGCLIDSFGWAGQKLMTS